MRTYLPKACMFCKGRIPNRLANALCKHGVSQLAAVDICTKARLSTEHVC
jgi:hypothetical protein